MFSFLIFYFSVLFSIIFRFLKNCWSSVVASVALPQLCNLHCVFFPFYFLNSFMSSSQVNMEPLVPRYIWVRPETLLVRFILLGFFMVFLLKTPKQPNFLIPAIHLPPQRAYFGHLFLFISPPPLFTYIFLRIFGHFINVAMTAVKFPFLSRNTVRMGATHTWCRFEPSL